MRIEDYKIRIDQLISQANEVLKTSRSHNADIISSRASAYSSVNREMYQLFRTASLSFIDKLFGDNHTYYKEFVKSVADHSPGDVMEGRGILNAIKQELDGGWLHSFKGLVSAEIFSDFLEMAGHLLAEGYKDPAAVMIGGVLEEHLRQLCLKNEIPISIVSLKDNKDLPKKADRMNSDLAGAGVYNKLYQKSVVSWLDLRNKAAHAEYDEYDILQVRLMETGVTDFIAKTSE